ncbi:putative efflux protein [Oscillibacter valericigenes Sjm18-20]|nr:putative efflux protein [Oscillibacter valericigenes Sjm18-20]
MILKGLRFGMLLQLAIGPICFMVFNTSTTYGFVWGLHLVLAIALVDTIYIALSCIGIASIINRGKIKMAVKLIGCFVLVLFGANTISGAFDLSFLPHIAVLSNISEKNLFVQGLLLTASNPLTIIFWGGVFSTQIIENAWNKKQLFLFAVGCVMATIIFLTAVAILGSILSSFLPQVMVKFLNVAVGVVLIFFGIRLLCKKDKGETTAC